MIPMHYITGRLGNQMFQHAYMYTQFRDGLIPDLFVQDEKYFTKYSGEIKALYGPGIGTIPSVAIHVRRGDYVGNDFYIDLFTDGYYERAMAEFPNAQFVVFSDDIEWCKQQDIFKNCAFSEQRDAVDDLNLMASCIGHIISNSSFSWWGAWLSPHKGKVVAPKQWFADGVVRVGLLDSWIRI